MNTPQEQIEAYLDNSLSPDERQAFEGLMAQDETLKKEVELERFMRKGLKALAYKEAFRAMHNSMTETTVIPLNQNQQRNARVFRVEQKHSWFKIYYAAAACLVAVAIGLWYYTQQSSLDVNTTGTLATSKSNDTQTADKQNNSNQDLGIEPKNKKPQIAAKLPAEDFLNEQEQTHLLRESQQPIDLSLTPAECEDLFQRYFNENDFSDEVFKSGIEALQQSKGGLNIFQEIVETANDGEIRQKAQWLATLAFLKNCNTTEALKLANVIRQINGHLYRNQAEKLYQRLR